MAVAISLAARFALVTTTTIVIVILVLTITARPSLFAYEHRRSALCLNRGDSRPRFSDRHGDTSGCGRSDYHDASENLSFSAYDEYYYG